MSRNLRPRKSYDELNYYEQDSKERKTELNKLNYAKKRKQILSKKKTEREEDRQAFNERQKIYYQENKEKINQKRRETWQTKHSKEKASSIKSRERENLNRELKELKQKYPYQIYDSGYDSITKKLYGRITVDDRVNNLTVYLPKDSNRFYCENENKYYKYFGDEKMTLFKFFKTVVKHDDCGKKHHSHQKEGAIILEEELIKEDMKLKHPYIEYTTDEMNKMHGTTIVKNGTKEIHFTPDKNRYFCERYQKHYVHLGKDRIDKTLFFEVVLRHPCDNCFHSNN